MAIQERGYIVKKHKEHTEYCKSIWAKPVSSSTLYKRINWDSGMEPRDLYKAIHTPNMWRGWPRKGKWYKQAWLYYKDITWENVIYQVFITWINWKHKPKIDNNSIYYNLHKAICIDKPISCHDLKARLYKNLHKGETEDELTPSQLLARLHKNIKSDEINIASIMYLPRIHGTGKTSKWFYKRYFNNIDVDFIEEVNYKANILIGRYLDKDSNKDKILLELVELLKPLKDELSLIRYG